MDGRLKIFIASLCLLTTLNGGVKKTIETIIENTITLVIPTVNAQNPASPSDHGFGRNATGGRGGDIYVVSNLNDSGSGSFREAITASGTRTIVFSVAGTIPINSVINVNNGNFTIAGETAPGTGIQFVAAPNMYIRINEINNFIIRNLRFRGNSGSSQSALTLLNDSTLDYGNGIIDHCSFSWIGSTTDEMGISIEGRNSAGTAGQWKDITISNCIFGEIWKPILQFKGHWNISYYSNYFYGADQRAPTSNYPDFQDASTLSFEVINNIWHDFKFMPVQASKGSRITVIGSKRTQSAGRSNYGLLTLIDIAPEDLGGGNAADTHVYETDNTNSIGAVYDSRTSPYIEASPYYTSDIIGGLILSNANVADILPTVGAFHWNRDSHDQRFVDYYTNNTGNTQGTWSGTPDTLTGTTPTDSDNDKMWDAAEIAIWGDITTTNNPIGDENGDGYTDIEETFFYYTGETTPSPEPTPSLKKAKIKGKAYLNGSPVQIYIAE